MRYDSPHKTRATFGRAPLEEVMNREVKLINHDFAKYGSAAERKRLLEKWDREVYAILR